MTGRNPIGNKWVFKNKLNARRKSGEIQSSVSSKGLFPVEGIDFGEIFSHVVQVNFY
jgi:hypothetical protein